MKKCPQHTSFKVLRLNILTNKKKVKQTDRYIPIFIEAPSMGLQHQYKWLKEIKLKLKNINL